MNIRDITALEILDSRGFPTILVNVELENGIRSSASVPGGTSIGVYEAKEIRDGDADRFFGKGVQGGLKIIKEKIAPAFRGEEIFFQKEIDRKLNSLDSSKDKSNFGANVLLGVSLACARAGAMAKKVELFEYLAYTYDFPPNEWKLPVPLFNIVNGGKHADTNIDVQEFHVIPFLLPEDNFSSRLEVGTEIFHALGIIFHENGFNTNVGLEGGYAPDMASPMHVFESIMQAIASSQNQSKKIFLGADVGASTLFNKETQKYHFTLNEAVLNSFDLIELYRSWFQKYPFLLLEDGMDQDDWEGWRMLTEEFGKNYILVGDDLFCTNPLRIQRGIKEHAANAIIVKPNQAGTLSETMAAVFAARRGGYQIIVSHRSGETNDSFVADLAVAIGAEFLKAGAPSRGERVAKYNRLLEIENYLHEKRKKTPEEKPTVRCAPYS